ncbi:small-conductance mechanosensitive channel [Granulicella aggregans]|uniref:Small-conductance mechanosensitive channel n=1 Tax=Granulicella aggregans TaxID=474949 RepID=A0A7W7ZEV9_9BACT|nr:mechanosensitive ion channel domain-containing protein [Granulicella aggregans]MBB5058680.1 small-conductance mechanosensitive channel [Granulicella aggregans]
MLLAIPAMVLVFCLVGLYLTRGAMANLSFLGDKNTGLVDQRPWQTVRALAPLAVSAEEQNFAQEAERLADHEVDQAFAQALREASTQGKTMTPEAQALAAKVSQLEDEVKADKARVVALGGDPKAKLDTGTAAATDSGNDDLDAAQTQLQLDSDELDDANENLTRATGDKRGTIQQELSERETAMKKSAVDGGGKTAIVSAKSRGTLAARIAGWFDQRSRRGLILEAKQQADKDAETLKGQHARIEAQAGVAAAAASAGLTTAGVPAQNAPSAKTTAASTVKPTTRVGRLQLLRTLSEEHSILEDRLATQQQLSKVYGDWAAQVDRQHKIVFHLMLSSFALIAFIVLCAVLAVFGIDLLVDRSKMEPRRMHTMKTIALLAVQAVSLLLVLLVVFGTPSQMPTILGLATAGVTVVFQDFILAFFGWFVLMGKNGIRVGDWVEINSVGGEVVEITLFRTMLMETGNWTDKGHPTGRRVTFINNFAITGQYFNFSTVGQWMWDEISLTIAAGDAAYKTIEAIRDRVIADTREDAHLAEQEWKLATRQQGLSQFSATPSVDLRPGAAGIDIIVRYVTRAGNRFEMRTKLYQALIDILQLQPERLA